MSTTTTTNTNNNNNLSTFSAVSVSDPANFSAFTPITNLLSGGQWDPSVSTQQGGIQPGTPYRAVFGFAQTCSVMSFQYQSVGDKTHDPFTVSVYNADTQTIYSTNVNIPLPTGQGASTTTVTLPTPITNITHIGLAFNSPQSGFQAIVNGPFVFTGIQGNSTVGVINMPQTFPATAVRDPNNLTTTAPITNLIVGGNWDPNPGQTPSSFTAIFDFSPPQNISIIQYQLIGDTVHDSQSVVISSNTTSPPVQPITIPLPTGTGPMTMIILLPMPLTNITELQMTWAIPFSKFQSIIGGPVLFAGISAALAAQCCANNGAVSGVNCGQYNGQPIGAGAASSPCGQALQMLGTAAFQDPNWVNYVQRNSGSGQFDTLVKAGAAITSNATNPLFACVIPQTLDKTIPPALAMILQANPQCTSTACQTQGYKLINQTQPCQINFQQCLNQQTVNNQGVISNAVSLNTSTNCQQMLASITGGNATGSGTGTTTNSGGSNTSGITGGANTGGTGTNSTNTTPTSKTVLYIGIGVIIFLFIVIVLVGLFIRKKKS